MSAIPIKSGIYWTGVQDYKLQIFDIVMETENGTSYNSYLIKGQQKTVLIETVKDKFFDEFIERVQGICPISDIDYLIVNHTEPDHTGSVEMLLKKNPNLVIMGSETALTFLEAICNTRFHSRPIGEGEELDLGGKTLQFIHAPFLHWPDSIFTYLKEDKILFTCDAFGCHYADQRVFNDLIDQDFQTAYKYYFDMILSPFKSYVIEALDKIKELSIDVICPGHGPILRTNLDYYIQLYWEWASPLTRDHEDKAKIVMAYVSAYGYTEMIGESIAEGLTMIDEFNFKKYDLVETSVKEVLAELETADGLLIGSPTINGDALPPVWELLTGLSPITHSRMVGAAFGDYGWSGEAVPNIESRLKMLRMQVLPGLRINFKPSERELEDAFSFGMDFARKVKEIKQDSSDTEWRCLVCGYIHKGNEPPAVCPACGVGAENFVKIGIEEIYGNNTEQTFVIIGGGIAALSAAEAVRKRDETASIIMLSEEEDIPYYRPMLSDYLSEDLKDERLYVKSRVWYEEKRIQLKTGSRVSAIDPAGKKVVLDDGTLNTYDRLIIATGARSNIPPFPGVDKKGIYALRSIEDACALKAALKQSKKAVVIGGGVLGLEAVWEMVSQGLDVSIVEFSNRIMPRQLDESSSLKLHQLIESHGVKLYLGRGTEEILGAETVQGVKLNDGTQLSADIVLLSTGVKPNMELAREAGIAVDRAIIVDTYMRTNQNDIYAAGDCAQIEGRNIGLWSIAMEMGRVAGANAAGEWLEYKQPVISTMLAAFNMEIFSVGEVNLPPEETRVTETWDPVEKYYKKSFLKNGVLEGEIIIAPQVTTGSSLSKLGRDETGKKRATRWKCRVCGYIHEGEEPPEVCPVCGAGKEMFDPVD